MALAAVSRGALAAPLFVPPLSRQASVPHSAPAVATAQADARDATAGATASLAGLGFVGAAVAAASPRGRGRRGVCAAAFDATKELGVQLPVDFWDPLGFCKDGDEAVFKRRRAVELKHGRVAMLACIGYIVPEYFRFPGYLSPSQDVQFYELPNGLAAIDQVPLLGWAQIVVFAGMIEARLLEMEKAPGDFGLGYLGAWGALYEVRNPEQRARKLNAELANGRLAMFAIMALLFQNGVTGSTGSELYFADPSAMSDMKFAISEAKWDLVPIALVFAFAAKRLQQPGP